MVDKTKVTEQTITYCSDCDEVRLQRGGVAETCECDGELKVIGWVATTDYE